MEREGWANIKKRREREGRGEGEGEEEGGDIVSLKKKVLMCYLKMQFDIN